MKITILAIVCYLIFCPFISAEDLSETKSDHFIIYYKDAPAEFVSTIIDYSERYYNELTQKLGFTRYDYWTWDKRAKIYVYPDQEAYIKETKQPSWSSGVAAYDQKTIWTFPRESGFFDSLLPHELGHIIFREVIGGTDVPLWLEEGVASYLEQAKRFGSDKVVLDALADKSFIPLIELTRIDANALRQMSNVNLFYAESVNVVSYLIDKFGPDAFNDFCKKLKDRRSLDDALAYAYFDIRNLSQLATLWEDSLKNKLRSKSKVIL